MKAIIFSNGDFCPAEWFDRLASDVSLVIAADGGARHALSTGTAVHELVGDMDSILKSDFERLKAAGTSISHYPENKDKSDLELAIDLAVEKGATEIHIIGSGGGRIDHTLSSYLVAAKESYREIQVWHYHGSQRALTLFPDERRVLTRKGCTVSVIPISSRIEKFSISGVEWPLNDVTLGLGSTLTISNRASSDEILVSFEAGAALLIIDDLS